MEFFKKNQFFCKGLQISLPTSPQPLPDIKFKSSYARKRDFGLLCPNMEIRPGPPNIEFLKNFLFLWKGLQISLPTSPQPPPDIKFKSSYASKRDFGLLFPNMEIWPQAPKNEFFLEIFNFYGKVSEFRF